MPPPLSDPPTADRDRLAELDAALVAPDAAARLDVLAQSGELAALLPEVHALIGFHRGSPLPHKDLWAHTLVVLARVAPEPDLRWIALCHDVGKVTTRALGPDGRLGFHRHEAAGARLFEGIAARLGMPPERAARIAFVIEHHARTNQFDPSWSDRALRRLARDAGEHLPLMLAFSAADWTTRKAARAERIQRQIEALRARLAALAEPASVARSAADRAARRELANALRAITGRPPGPWLIEALRWAEAERARSPDDALDARALAARWSLALPDESASVPSR